MKKRVLLCDDDEQILQTVEFALKRAGFQVLAARDGNQAWKLFEEQPPDVLVTDYRMPRMNGLELVQRIRDTEETAHVPVVMITAASHDISQQIKLKALQISAIVAKPFSPHELLHCVQRAIETRLPSSPMAFYR